MSQQTFTICPKCKRKYYSSSQQSEHCLECGSPLIQNCPNPGCNKQMHSELDEFCRYCGIRYAPYLDK